MTIDFLPPRVSDRSWVVSYLNDCTLRASEYNFTNLYVWHHSYRQTCARVGDFLVVRLLASVGPAYLWPLGHGDLKGVLLALMEDAASRNCPFHLIGLGPNEQGTLEELFPQQFSFTQNPNWSDYLYDINRLADLGGKKLHAKRNHCNRFAERPNWRYQPLTADLLSACLAMDEQWYQATAQDGQVLPPRETTPEGIAIRRAMDNFEGLHLEGGVLLVDEAVVAFTVGDRLTCDTYDIHFEKAYSDMQGAFAMINREFARQLRTDHPELRYLNREDDMGLEGLRRAKESYYPDLMVGKINAALTATKE